MAAARKLIEERDYNNAILLLTTVVREEPDRQDEAQELISEIVKLRNQYNDEYERLINLLYTQKDEATALKVIASLEALDKNPNKQTKDDIDQAKRAARLIANNKRYRDIMARALAHLDKREYGAAVQVYLEGSDLAKDMFLESGFGNVLTNQVDRAWADLQGASNQFILAEPALKLLPTQGAALLASDVPVKPDLDSALGRLQTLAAWRQRIWDQGRLFKSQNEFLVKNSRQSDFFLQYSYLFVNGPTEVKKSPEGILGALDRMWSETLDPWTVQIRTAVDARYLQAKADFDRQNYGASAREFDSLRVLARQGLDAVTLWNRISGIDETGAPDPVYRAKLAQLVPLAAWLEHRLSLGLQGSRASRDLAKGLGLAQTAALDRPALEAARAEVRGQKDVFASNARTASLWTAQTQALGGDGLVPIDTLEFSRNWQVTWASFRQQALGLEADFVDRRGTLDYGLLSDRYQGLMTVLAGLRTQVEGTVKFSSQAADKLGTLQPQHEALGKDIGAFIALYEGEPEDVQTQAVQRWPARGRDLLDLLNSARSAQAQLLAEAKKNYADSQAFKKAGQDLVPQITQAVGAADTKEKFQAARNLLDKMSGQYAQSLSLQEDASFRTDSDNQYSALNDQINKAYNELVVRETRKLITLGSQQYLDQQTDQARGTLVKAENLWKETHTDPNEEVEYWFQLVKSALSVTSGREVSPIDPLYNEVQQLLNFAHRDFSLGQDQQTAGQTATALEAYQEALETLNRILQLFNHNQEASLLKAQIQKVVDPDKFQETFKKSFKDAVDSIRAKPDQAYQTLQDLKVVQADYPGLDQAIKDVRLRLGLDRPAVDPKVTAQVRSLVVRSASLVNAGQLNEAQALVIQALNLDPNNAAAQALTDTIYLRKKATSDTLTPTQNQRLLQIQAELRAGQTVQALSDMTRFKTDFPDVVNNKDVKETDRRIKAVTSSGA